MVDVDAGAVKGEQRFPVEIYMTIGGLGIDGVPKSDGLAGDDSW